MVEFFLEDLVEIPSSGYFEVIYLILSISSFWEFWNARSFFLDLFSSCSEYFFIIESPSTAFLVLHRSLLTAFLD